MNYNKKTVKDVDVKGKKVLLRCDFNVPQDKEGNITDDKRIRAALPTIQYLLDNGAAVIACSHLGKPVADFDKWVKKQTEKGKDPATLTQEKWEKTMAALTLAPVAKRLGELLGKDVTLASDTVGADAQAKAAALQPGQVLLLEASFLANSGSFLVSPLLKRVFSSSRIWPGCSAAALEVASGPTTSCAIMTSLPSSSLRRTATGFRDSSGLISPLGFPMWEQAITAAPLSSRYWMVGSAARMRLSSVMTLVFLSRGTLKSQRRKTFLPFTSTWVTFFLL